MTQWFVMNGIVILPSLYISSSLTHSYMQLVKFTTWTTAVSRFSW